MLAPNQHNTASTPNRATIPGPVVHNETTATSLGGFVTILANLTRRAYVLEEYLTQHMMGYLQSLADLNPQIAIGRSLRPDQERHVHRLVNPLSPIEEEYIPVTETFSQDPTQLPFSF